MSFVREGLTGTYNQTVGVRLDIDEAIHILTPSDVPLQQWAGSEGTTAIKVEWLEEDLTPQEVTSTSDAVTGTDPWVVTLEADQATILRPGDVLYRRGADPDVQWVVSSVDFGADEVTVTGFAGNTTAPGTEATYEIVGQYRIEGSDPEDARSIERVMQHNFTQTGQEKVEVTRTARKRGLYGLEDPYTHEVSKKFKELAIRFERSMVNGVRTVSADNQRRFMGGLFYYISDNQRSGTKSQVKARVNELMRDCYEDGGTPGTLWVSPAVKVAISESFEPELRRTDRSDRTSGYVTETILTDFGEIEVKVNRHFPVQKGVLAQREFVKRRVFDPYFHELLSKTGDADKGHIVGEFSLQVKNEKAHGILTVTDA